jgi:hypothetical protein
MAFQHWLAIIPAFFAVFGFTNSAQAIVIASSAKVAPSPALPGEGLNGEFWDTLNTRNLTSAQNTIAGGVPDATFLASSVDYPNGLRNLFVDNRTLEDFLGVDGASLSGAQNTPLRGSVFRLSGFISILDEFDSNADPSAIDVTFSVRSDDGFQLNIGGETVAQFTGLRPFGNTSGVASFAQPGLYPIELIYFENRIAAGVEFASSFSQEPDGIVPTDILYTQVPSQAVPFELNSAAGVAVLGIWATWKLRQWCRAT